MDWVGQPLDEKVGLDLLCFYLVFILNDIVLEKIQKN
jgi:hypothetical protein